MYSFTSERTGNVTVWNLRNKQTDTHPGKSSLLQLCETWGTSRRTLTQVRAPCSSCLLALFFFSSSLYLLQWWPLNHQFLPESLSSPPCPPPPRLPFCTALASLLQQGYTIDAKVLVTRQLVISITLAQLIINRSTQTKNICQFSKTTDASLSKRQREKRVMG